MTIVGFLSMNAATGPDATSMTVIATITAMYMIARCSVIPTAVMIEFDREHEVEQQDLKDRCTHRDVDCVPDDVVLVVLWIDGVMDLFGRLPDKKQAASNQDQIAPGEAVTESGENRGCKLDDVGEGRKQDEPHQQSRHDAEPPGLGTVLRGKLVGQDRDKDQVIDAEHHLHRDKRHHGGPSLSRCKECKVRREEIGGHGIAPWKAGSGI